jgi:hypothetical protein
MQESTLTKDKIPGSNRRLMQQAFTRLMVPSHWVYEKEQPGSWKGQDCLRRSPNCFIRPVWGVNFIIKIDLVKIETGC